MPDIPKSVSKYMSEMAKRANASMRGTAMAKERASTAAAKRWAKERSSEKHKKKGQKSA